MSSPQRLVMSTSLNSNLRILPRVSLSPSMTSAYHEQRQGKVHSVLFRFRRAGDWHTFLIHDQWYFFPPPPSVNKPFYRSMENLNSAFQGQDNHTNMGGGHFQTLPLSGFSFTRNSDTSPSGHLMVPRSCAAFSTQTVPRNPRVVPMITRSQSSSNLPENTTENLYDEVGGGLGSHMNHKMPKKSCSQWDMVRASGKSNHLQVGRGQQIDVRPNMW